MNEVVQWTKDSVQDKDWNYSPFYYFFILITSWLSHFHEMEQGNYPFFFLKPWEKGKENKNIYVYLKQKMEKKKKDTSENIL